MRILGPIWLLLSWGVEVLRTMRCSSFCSQCVQNRTSCLYFCKSPSYILQFLCEASYVHLIWFPKDPGKILLFLPYCLESWTWRMKQSLLFSEWSNLLFPVKKIVLESSLKDKQNRMVSETHTHTQNRLLNDQVSNFTAFF